MQNKLTPEEFKGTFEYNHANRIDLVNEESIKLATNNIPKNEEFKYLLAYEVIDGYCKFDSKTFFTPLGKNFKNTLYIIKKCE